MTDPRGAPSRTTGPLVRRLLGAALALVAVAPGARAQGVAPVVPGLAGEHPLDGPAVGALLAGELRCAACHPALSTWAPAPPGPDLSGAALRLRPEFLRRFLAAPRATQPGTKMPDVLHALPEAERAEAAESLTHFLMSLAQGPAPSELAGEASAQRGADLFHGVGCVACHAPRRAPESASEVPSLPGAGVGLEHVPLKYEERALAEFLFDPLRTRPAGRMPDLGLSREEARDLARYLVGAQDGSPAFTPDLARVEAGRREFQARGCLACHALDGLGAPAATPIEDAGAGCLDPGRPAGVDYALSEPQRAALGLALRAAPAPSTPAEEVAATLTALNCIACHVREDYGGVAPELDPYFTTDEPNLGDAARIPPPLTLVGAKLDGTWLRDVVLEGASVRPYMQTRMPRFGGARLAALPGLLERVDVGRVEPFAMPVPEGDARNVALDAGRELMGVRGLACISCHDLNGIPANGQRGLDLITTSTRLRPEWFARFLFAPSAFRPGIVMPESWPDGVAAHQGILDGDSDAQVRALWAYLAEGRTIRTPDGLRPEPSLLEVDDVPRLYRGRSSVAGFRGIAVGFPGGLNYAFDAQDGTLAALWRGEFVSVRWDGQGAGDFQPRARSIELARDVSFARLPDASAAWPLAPVTTEEQPVNPDPTYPRNHGYRFRGYSIPPDGVPTLRYASGAVEVVERSEPVAGESGAVATLRRTLTLTAPAAETLWLRLLDRQPDEVRGREVRAGALRLRLPDVPIHPRAPSDGRPGDLLLRLDLPAGETRLDIDYALLD